MYYQMQLSACTPSGHSELTLSMLLFFARSLVLRSTPLAFPRHLISKRTTLPLCNKDLLGLGRESKLAVFNHH